LEELNQLLEEFKSNLNVLKERFNLITVKKTKFKDSYRIDNQDIERLEKTYNRICSLSKITEKINIEKKVRESEEKYRTLFEGANDAIFLMDKVTFIECNKKTLEIFGCERKNDIIGVSPWIFSPLKQPDGRDSKDKALEMINNALNGKPQMFYWKHIRKDGTPFDAEVSLNRLDLENRTCLQAIVRDITEKVNAEKKIRESEEKYRSLFEGANNAILLSDLGRYIECNKKTLEIFRCKTKKDIIGLTPWELSPPTQPDGRDSKEEAQEYIKKTMKEEPQSFYWKFMRKDGTLFDAEVFINRIDLEDKIYRHAIIRDITARKKMEKLLQESEVKFRSIVENSHDGIFIVNDKYEFIYANNELCKILGYSLDEIIGQNFRKFLDNKSKEIVSEYYIRRQRGEKLPLRYKFNIVRKTGEKRHVEISVTVVEDLMGGVKTIAQILDITDRIIAEQKLRESEKKYRELVETSPNSIILLDDEGIIISCNKITESSLNLPRDQIIGLNYLELNLLKDNISWTKKVFKKVIKKGIIEPFEFELIDNQGKKIWARNLVSFITMNNKQYIQITSEDITERKKIEIMIKDEIKKLKEIDAIKTEFVSRASHELKTPLTSILSASRLLDDLYQDKFDERANLFVDIIIKGGERLENLTKDLLDVSKISSEGLKIEKQQLNIREVLTECVKGLQILAKERNLSIKVDISEDIFINIDRTRIEQVITNLLSNSIKNTPPYGEISIILEKYLDRICILIKDTGVGFTSDEISKIFKKFGKIERYGRGMDVVSEGTGLGLYISKEIIEMHGGDINVYSKGRNKGSTITISLPY
jgi:PAS domain S-box-containing protein